MSLTAAPPTASPEYRVQDDLNRESLPQTQRDPSRKIAWTNAICTTVLGIGLLLRREAQQFNFKPELVESAPVVIPEFVPEPPQQDEQVVEDKAEEQPEAAVVPVVVAPDASKVNFAVPVTGPTVKAADFKYAGPPPRVTQRPTQSGPTVFRGGPSGDGGFYEKPPYPRDALLRKEQGDVQLFVVVGEDGTPLEVSTRVSSGSPTLDRESIKFVKRYWRWPAGPRREFYVPLEYHLQ
jgi:protein TonB